MLIYNRYSEKFLYHYQYIKINIKKKTLSFNSKISDYIPLIWKQGNYDFSRVFIEPEEQHSSGLQGTSVYLKENRKVDDFKDGN